MRRALHRVEVTTKTDYRIAGAAGTTVYLIKERAGPLEARLFCAIGGTGEFEGATEPNPSGYALLSSSADIGGGTH